MDVDQLTSLWRGVWALGWVSVHARSVSKRSSGISLRQLRDLSMYSWHGQQGVHAVTLMAWSREGSCSYTSAMGMGDLHAEQLIVSHARLHMRGVLQAQWLGWERGMLF